MSATQSTCLADGPLVVSGASGQLGQLILHHLLDSYCVPPSNVIAITRSVDKLSGYQQKGVNVRFGDFDKPESLAKAFSGGTGQRKRIYSSSLYCTIELVNIHFTILHLFD